MKHKQSGRFDVVVGISLAVAIAGASGLPKPSFSNHNASANAAAASTLTAKDLSANSYTVQLDEPALASYRGGTAGYDAPPRVRNGVDNKLDAKAPASRAYVTHLKQKQAAFLQSAAQQLGRSVHVNFSYTNVLNGMSLKISAAEADTLAKMPGVVAVTKNTTEMVHTDSGPQWIGAPGVWNGTSTNGLPGTKGEGVVLGILDSGINFENTSFAATGGDGYTVQNPLGAGTFLGTCATGGVDVGKCNNKLIGAYDLIHDVACPGDVCDDGYDDTYGAFDQNGHGSHTASTSGGNATTATVQGASVAISGVAPHANLIAYQICITIVDPASANYGSASCYSDASIAAADQAVADGVDVINYSIGGGTTPWTDTVSQAFLNATDAGIFISASAGNSGPTVSSVSHREPWTISVAAMTHDRLFSDSHVSVTAPTPVPAALASLAGVNASPASSGTAYTGPKTGELHASGNVIACTANGGFTNPGPAGFIALISRGTCSFAEKVQNATAAGASAVVMYNNSGAPPIVMSVPSTTIPSMMVSKSDGQALAAFVAANATNSVTVDLSTPPVFSHNPSFGDILASFSSRGPNDGFALMKPEIGGPGVSILAAYSGADTLVDPTAGEFAFLQGTSMSSPHVAGSGALLHAVHPTWTPMELKSALMLTAKTTNLFKDDAVTPATPLEVGAGRVDISRAARSPLVMNETASKMLQANPAATPAGDPSKLNMASLDSLSCAGTCTFTRTLRSVASSSQTYTASLGGATGGLTGTITPSTFTIPPGTSKTLTIVLNTSAVTVGSYAFGSINLVPAVNADDVIFADGFEGTTTNAVLPVHLPVAVRSAATVTPPNIQVTPTTITKSQATNTSTTTAMTVGNTGGMALTWTTAGGTTNAIVSQQATTGTNGILTGYYDTSVGGVYTGDDFALSGSTQVTKLFFDGFANSATLATQASSISFYIYPDASGSPAGQPEDGLNLQVWKYTAAVGSAGLDLTNNQITIDLVAAGASPPTLAAGTYWLVVAPKQSIAYNASTRWNWFGGAPATGSPAKLIDPNDLFAGGFTSWTSAATLTGNAALTGMSYKIYGAVPCGASWISLAPTGATTAPAGSTPVTATIDSTGLAAGSYSASLCFSSNDPVKPVVTVPVSLTVTGPSLNAPTLAKAFSPTSVATSTNSTLTITLSNSNASALTLSSALTDTLPSGLVASGTPTTTCTGGTASLGAAGASVILSSGAQIPLSGSCTVTATVSAASANTYNNTIAAGALVTNGGSNAAAASASLTVTTPVGPPTVAKSFSPTSITAGGSSTLTITLSNGNATAATLSAALTDTFPSGLVVGPTPGATNTCGGTFASTAGATSVSLSGGAIPANGTCSVSVAVTAAATGSYVNTIAAGALQTSAGNNAAAASATLTANPASCTQPLLDPSFETTNASTFVNPSWPSSDSRSGTPFCTNAGCGGGLGTDGDWFVWFGGYPSGTETGNFSQAVTIPSGGSRFLNFYMLRTVPSPDTSVVANLVVTVDSTQLLALPKPTSTDADFVAYSLPIPAALANGASHTVNFAFAKTGTGATGNVFIDEVTLDCAALTAGTRAPSQNHPITDALRNGQ